MPIDTLVNVNCFRAVCADLISPEDLAALSRFNELLRARLILGSSEIIRDTGGDWLPVLALADDELSGLCRFLRQVSGSPGTTGTSPETHTEILAAYRQELASSFACFLDEVRGDLRQMADPPLPALMNWSQSRRQAGSSFRTRWPHTFVPPEKLAQAEAPALSLAEVVEVFDAAIQTLEAVADHCRRVGESLPELSEVGNVLFAADPAMAAKEEPLAVAGIFLSGLSEELEDPICGLRSDRLSIQLGEQPPATGEGMS